MRKFCKEISLAYLNPKLVEEWYREKNYPLTPEMVRQYSGKKVWWKCNKGHQWFAEIKYRSKGGGCPCCSRKKVCSDNCLSAVNAELAEEWDYEKNYPLTPETVSAHNNKKVWWKCNKGHRYEMRVADRSRGHGCSYCAGRKVCEDNCLATVNPILAKEWDYEENGLLRPDNVTVSSRKRVKWICKNNHKWAATISNRTIGNGCPYCAGQKVCRDNCLSTVNPRLANEWNYSRNNGLTPDDITIHNGLKVWWMCQNGHEWATTTNHRSFGYGCPSCSKIELKDGVICDSLPEAYYYLKLKADGVAFKHHVGLGLGRCICDFYIPSINKYIEVTGFSKQWKYWEIYCKNILKKKQYIIENLGAKFKFVQLKLTSSQIQHVRENSR